MITLFDSYDGYDFEDYKRDFLAYNDWGATEESLDDNMIWDIISDQQSEDWAYAMETLSALFQDRWGGDGAVVARGTAGGWRGAREATNIFFSITDAINRICLDCDYIKIWQDNNRHLFVKASHHDGTHTFELKPVTTDGARYYEKWEYGIDPRTDNKDEWYILTQMWNSSKYTKLPNKLW